MKPINISLILLLIIILLRISNGSKPAAQPLTRSNDEVLSVAQEDILIENRGVPIKVTDDFPIPQTTTLSKSLSTNYPEDLSIITSGATIPNSDVVVEMRTGLNPLSGESHFPNYYRKDTMSGSTIGNTEYKFAEVDNLKSSHAWSDENVSQYPTFYTSQVKDEITNVGSFFDQNNQFVDTTNPRSDANVDDICFTSREGEKVCLDNSRQYNIPPSLVGNKSNCGFLNSIGLLEFTNRVNEDGERVNNGGYLYDKVKGAKKHNETYSEPIKQPILDCQV